MTVLAWPLTLAACLFMYPWAKYLLQRAEGSALLPTSYRLLLALTTLALSLGMLTLIMMWIGILGLTIDWRLAGLLCLFIGAAGWFLPARAITFQPDRQPIPPQPLRNLMLIAYLLVVVIAALVLFNAVYWPFSLADAVTIYASYGKQIATTGSLPVGNLYETYPMFIPLAYTFVQQMSGWANEYLAALIPAMLSVGVIGVAYLLGAELLNRSAGIIAALLIALAPMYTHWASSGYVDLPCGFRSE